MPTDRFTTDEMTAILELGSEVPEIGTGGWERYKHVWVMHPDEDDSQGLIRQVEHATETDYDAACWRVARWLSKKGFVCVRDYFLGHWLYYEHGCETGQEITCPDDELAALVAAAREVMG